MQLKKERNCIVFVLFSRLW